MNGNHQGNTMEKQLRIKCQMKHSVKIPFLFWKYDVGRFLDSCVEMCLYGTEILAYLHLTLGDLKWSSGQKEVIQFKVVIT